MFIRGRFILCIMYLMLLSSLIFADTPRELYQRGREQLDQQDYVGSVASFRNALELNPQYLDAWTGISEAFLQMQEFDQALISIQRARELAGNSLDVRNLHADILLSLGQIDAAAEIYAEVRRQEPNNIDALIGEAQIALARNNPESAAQTFSRALERSPRHRTALLSLALVAEASGQSTAADRYIESALTHHNDNPTVHYIAARSFFTRGEIAKAQYHVSTSLSLRQAYPEALLLQAEISLDSNHPEQAIAVMEQLLEINPDEVRAWYISGIAEHALREYDASISHLERALRLQPGNEYIRGTYETILRRQTDFDDPRRDTAARYHETLAKGYRNQNLSGRAGFHYRRALQLAPYSETARRGYAETFLENELYARYVEELELLNDLEVDDQPIQDALEVYQSLLLDSVAYRWDIDQFNLERITIPLQIFVQGSIAGYPEIQNYLPAFVQDVFSANPLLEFIREPSQVATESEAFQASRDAGTEYYIVITPQVFNDGVQITSEVYLSRTGSRIAMDSTIREGAQALSRALWELQERAYNIFPLQAQIVERRFRNAIIDRGRVDGIEEGSELPLYPARSGIPRSDGPGLLFPADAQLGQIVIDSVDDTIALGRIVGGGFFDRVNVGDVAVRQPEGISSPPQELSSFPPLYRQIRALD